MSFSSNLEDIVTAMRRRSTDILRAIDFGIFTPSRPPHNGFRQWGDRMHCHNQDHREYNKDSVPYVADYVRTMEPSSTGSDHIPIPFQIGYHPLDPEMEWKQCLIPDINF